MMEKKKTENIFCNLPGVLKPGAEKLRSWWQKGADFMQKKYLNDISFKGIALALLRLLIDLHVMIGDAFIWLIKKCCVPFRYIHAGISYALLFLIVACGVILMCQFGEGTALTKNPRELLPAHLFNKNEIQISDSEVSMFFKTLSPEQRKVYLDLKKEYSQIVSLKKELEALEKAEDPAIQELSEDDLKRKKEENLKKQRDLRYELVQKAKPITGFGPEAFRGIGSFSITPEILEVTITIVNVNQGDAQPFSFRLYNPDMDLEAENLPPVSRDAIAAQVAAWCNFEMAMPEEAKAICDRFLEWQQSHPDDASANLQVDTAEYLQAEWLLQNAILKKLCHKIREKQSFDDQHKEALKLKDAADLAARKLKDEARRNEILGKRVEDYFCDSIAISERNLLDAIILAVNKDTETPSSANKHETEKVYVYVNRIPPKINIGYSQLNDLPLISAFLQVLKYSDENDFVFAGNNVKNNLETCFRCVNTRVISPAEQRERISQFLQRDIVGEELEKINAAITAEAVRKNKQNEVRLENEIMLAIARRPEGSPPLTPEGRANIALEVEKQLNLKQEIPILKRRNDVTQDDKQRWIEAAMESEGIDQSNLFYLPLVVETVRENQQLNSVRFLLNKATGMTLCIIFVLFAICAFAVFFSQRGMGIVNAVRKRFRPDAPEITADSEKWTRFCNACYWSTLAGLCIFFVYWCILFWNLCDVPDQILGVLTEKELFSPEEKTQIWLHFFNFWVPGFLLWLIAICALFTPGAKRDFCRPASGESFLVKLFAMKKGSASFPGTVLWVVGYILCLLLLPYLLLFQYINIIPNPFAPIQDEYMQLDAYNIPGGGGDSMPSKPVVVKKIKKKKIKKYIINPRTSIIFEIPDLNDEEHMEEIDTATETQYATGNMFGKGKKTGKPGWAGGMENAKIRFIRLQYNGANWDWNMGKGADYNMLVYLRDQIHFNVANDTESVSINKLARGFRKGKKPPFVYLTGRGAINLSATEVKQLNEYLLKDGGMIFADNAGGNFDSGFRNMIRRVLPNHKLVDIANDDPIYTAPFFFPNGAPAFFHHSGSRALGIKNNGRWVVFYHQGDIGDAWKGAGLTEQQRTDAFKLGANVISYAFGAYLESNSEEK